MDALVVTLIAVVIWIWPTWGAFVAGLIGWIPSYFLGLRFVRRGGTMNWVKGGAIMLLMPQVVRWPLQILFDGGDDRWLKLGILGIAYLIGAGFAVVGVFRSELRWRKYVAETNERRERLWAAYATAPIAADPIQVADVRGGRLRSAGTRLRRWLLRRPHQ